MDQDKRQVILRDRRRETTFFKKGNIQKGTLNKIYLIIYVWYTGKRMTKISMIRLVQNIESVLVKYNFVCINIYDTAHLCDSFYLLFQRFQEKVNTKVEKLPT